MDNAHLYSGGGSSGFLINISFCTIIQIVLRHTLRLGLESCVVGGGVVSIEGVAAVPGGAGIPPRTCVVPDRKDRPDKARRMPLHKERIALQHRPQ